MAQQKQSRQEFETRLKVGDPVMIIAGGNSQKGKALCGVTGKIKRLLPKKHRVVVEGANMIKRHQRARSANEPAGIIEREGSVHISNVMYYAEEAGRPVRVKVKAVDGRKVRGFVNPKTKQFEQIDV